MGRDTKHEKKCKVKDPDAPGKNTERLEQWETAFAIGSIDLCLLSIGYHAGLIEGRKEHK